jgi:Zn ribbon nucleic-acid-binding protein
MDILCPNCKQTADLRKIGEVEHIECPDCGWFKVQADSTFVACDNPPGPEQTEQTNTATPEPAMPEPAHGDGPVPTSEGNQPIQEKPSSLEVPSDEPGHVDEDLDEFEEEWGNVSITLED